MGRPEQILEVDALVEEAAIAMADSLVSTHPHIDRGELFDAARAEFSCAAEDLCGFFASQYGSYTYREDVA